MKKILIVGALAGLSAVAMAQSAQSDKSKEPSAASAQATSSQDAASGQTAEKRMHKPITVTAEVGREASTGKATGKTSAHDDWQAPSAKIAEPKAAEPKTSEPKTTPNQVRVAPADVNGDGKADAVKPGQPTLHNTAATSSDVKSPRDISTGQSSGKQAQPAAAHRESPTKQSDGKR